MNDTKVFKLGVGNDLGISDKGQRLGLGLTAIRQGFELYECLLVSICCQLFATAYIGQPYSRLSGRSGIHLQLAPVIVASVRHHMVI